VAGNIVSGSTEEAIKSALKELDLLFHMPPGDEECVVSEADIVAGVIQVFKQMKFAASSLYDFGELQATLRYVIDVMFWVLMMIVFQIIVQFDISTVLAPAITVLLMLSFAFGPLFGNLFLATAFVVFMLPFDIGDRVVIGNAGPSQIICYIRSIGLMYTTVETIYKDKVRSLP
jgi:small-conductance mechanosensitive channel